MCPAYRDLDGLEPMSLGEEEYLRVEAKAFDALLLENDPCRLAEEGLEAALRVEEIEAGDRPHNGVEDDAGKLPQPRLVDLDQA